MNQCVEFQIIFIWPGESIQRAFAQPLVVKLLKKFLKNLHFTNYLVDFLFIWHYGNYFPEI